MLFLLLAAEISILDPTIRRQPVHPLEHRVTLLEVKEILNSKQLWKIRSQLSPEVIEALDDLQLHLKADELRDEHLRALTSTVDELQARLAAVEGTLRGKNAEGAGPIPVAPVVAQRASPKKGRRKPPLR